VELGVLFDLTKRAGTSPFGCVESSGTRQQYLLYIDFNMWQKVEEKGAKHLVACRSRILLEVALEL
jgi:hypothetical protein